MSTVTHEATYIPTLRRAFVQSGLVVFFWLLAALPMIVASTAAMKIGTIVVVAWLYVRFGTRHCTVDQALLVGLTWLLLDIAAEIATTRYLGHGWFDLIGSPAHHGWRDVLLLTWIGAPALFAKL